MPYFTIVYWMKKIVLLGYMGVGKSFLGKELAKITRRKFIDLDEYIQKNENACIEKLFQTKGELYFRKKEHYYLKEILSNNEEIVLSLGGGTPCYYNNMDLVQKDGIISVYLKASVETLFQRLKDQKSKRPLIAGTEDDDLKEFIAKHLFDRSYFYNLAKIKISIDEKEIDELVNEMILLIR
jgi:shikimate kinase